MWRQWWIASDKEFGLQALVVQRGVGSTLRRSHRASRPSDARCAVQAPSTIWEAAQIGTVGVPDGRHAVFRRRPSTRIVTSPMGGRSAERAVFWRGRRTARTSALAHRVTPCLRVVPGTVRAAGRQRGIRPARSERPRTAERGGTVPADVVLRPGSEACARARRPMPQGRRSHRRHGRPERTRGGRCSGVFPASAGKTEMRRHGHACARSAAQYLMMMRSKRASVRVPDATGQGGGVEASVTENLRRGGAPPQEGLYSVPPGTCSPRQRPTGLSAATGSMRSLDDAVRWRPRPIGD